MKVYTYYEPVAGINVESQLRELSVWKASWERFGFRPVILNRTVAEQHSQWAEFVARVVQYPTINPAGYDLHCYQRWLALVVAGGGLMTDYDVVNVGLTPEAVRQRVTYLTCLCPGGVPAVVHADGTGMTRLIDALWAGPRYQHHENGQPHVSDMILFQQRAVFQGDHTWDACREAHETCLSPLVHCSHHSMGRLGVDVPRWQFMASWSDAYGLAQQDPTPIDEEFSDLTEQAGAEGREDTQGCWQEVVGAALQGYRVQSVLDVGAGLGASKARLAKYVSRVTTQDLGPVTDVDLHIPVDHLPPKTVDTVTAFDVVEHVRGAEAFMRELGRVARRFVVVSTPNFLVTGNRHRYHYREMTPVEAIDALERAVGPVRRAWAMFTDHSTELLPEDLHGAEGLGCGNFVLMAKVDK